MGHSLLLSVKFRPFNAVDIKQRFYVYKSLPIFGFEPQTSGVGSDRSTNRATTTAQSFVSFKRFLTNYFLNWTSPASFLFIFVIFKHKLYRKNCSFSGFELGSSEL